MHDRPRISPAYLEQQRRLHDNPAYGVASIGFAPIVRELVGKSGARSLSDYGAGKCKLRDRLRELGCGELEYRPYDPAFPEYGPPAPADLVCCIDVLEHVEPDYLEPVLLDLREITRRLAFLTVHTGPAQKLLDDGRNAHLTQQPPSWWLPRLCEHFEIEQFQRTAKGFWVIASPRGSAPFPVAP
jgi:hypothetical protein